MSLQSFKYRVVKLNIQLDNIRLSLSRNTESLDKYYRKLYKVQNCGKLNKSIISDEAYFTHMVNSYKFRVKVLQYEYEQFLDLKTRIIEKNKHSFNSIEKYQQYYNEQFGN